jgi:hypothetical protein
MTEVVPEVSSCKYLGIMLRSNLSSADQVNYKVKKKPEMNFILQRVFLKRETVILKVWPTRH